MPSLSEQHSWVPSDWRSRSAWIEAAHHASRILRRDVAHVTPQQIRQAIDMASYLNPGPFGGDFRVWATNHWEGAKVTWRGEAQGSVMWIHGGAFAFGSPRVYRAAAVHLARATRCEVLLPSYRLAPEHVYPAAHDDVYEAIEEMIRTRSQPWVLIGDSAGGNLAMSALSRAIEEKEGTGKLCGIALLSPWCDLRENAASILQNQVAHSPFDLNDSKVYSRSYLREQSPSDVRVSPLMISGFEGWPPIYLEWAEDEFLAPDVELLKQKMTNDQADLTWRTEEQAVHGWQLLPDILPEAKRSMRRLGGWIGQVMR